jgi:hypothetical protein
MSSTSNITLDSKGNVKESPGKKKNIRNIGEFTIDEEFFHNVILPSVYSTVLSGVKQEHIALFNLLFSIEIGLKKQTISIDESEFLVNNLFKFPNFLDWRKNNA